MSESFLETPSDEAIKQSICNFIDRTNNNAIQILPCAVCARETLLSELQKCPVKDIPNKSLLIPHTPHPKHDLYQMILLHPPGVTNEQANICNECFRALQRKQLPKFSLANDMWIGEIPKELSMLTLPERMLIAIYYPSAYIFKLFPKKTGSRAWDQSQMYQGLKGNVSTYRLDPKQVANMIDGVTMPPPVGILSSTIGITFLGPSELPEKTMPNIFRIQRARVKSALLWLKANNPLYRNIVISEHNLLQLPENGIPEELILTARYSSDLDALNAEQDGYVPQDAADDERK